MAKRSKNARYSVLRQMTRQPVWTARTYMPKLPLEISIHSTAQASMAGLLK